MTCYSNFVRHVRCGSTIGTERNAFLGHGLLLAFLRTYLPLIPWAASTVIACAATRALADDPKNEAAERQKLEFITKKLDEFAISTQNAQDQPMKRVKEPVLRLTNPVRDGQADGAVIVWLSGERPAALACLWIRNDGGVWREFTSFSDEPLRCERGGRMVWAPKSSSSPRKPLPDASKPAATPALRLSQMRRLAERFSGDFELRPAKRWEALRLMPQPLYRFTAEKGAVEGAIFALVQANDPEILVMLELGRPAQDAPPTWSYALARMSSQKLRLRLDDKEVWTAEPYWSNPRRLEDPYMEGPDGKYPGFSNAKPAPKRE